MPRPPRIHYPGAVYHVMARGVDGRDVFIDDRDRFDFLRTIVQIKEETPHSILAYCLMGNHFHLAIKVGGVPLFRVMQRLLTTYVLHFNARHARNGHLFQARYKSVLCVDDRYLITLIRYIHMNPVRAKLVTSPAEWAWSSYREYSARVAAPIIDSRLFYSALGETEIDFAQWSLESDDFSPWPTAESPATLVRNDTMNSPSIDELAQGMLPEEIQALKSGNRQRDIVARRSIFVARAARHGHSLVEIAAWLSCSPSTAHRLLRANNGKTEKPDPFVVSA